ncbi:MAG: hypothetical protein ACPGVP_16325 [Thiolinea sp.]
MKYFLPPVCLISLLLVLLPAISYGNPYDVNYFLKNPDDIPEQLDICNIQIWKAKTQGNLADVKAAKNNPACVAAKQAQKKIREDEAANAEKAYEMQKAARKAMKEAAAKMAAGNTMAVLQAKKQNCDKTPHPVLGAGGSACAKLRQAIAVRKKLDAEAAVAGFRNGGGRMTEKERFVLLSTPGGCKKAYDYQTCQFIQKAQYLDEQEYRDAFDKDKNAAEVMLEKCKPPFFKALAKAKAIENAGDRMRAVGIVVNLKEPPFDNPLACKTAATSLGTAFGMMAYE